MSDKKVETKNEKVAQVETVSASANDTYSYRGWLNSDSFLKRAFGVYGYLIVAQIIVSVIFFVLFVVMTLLFVSAM